MIILLRCGFDQVFITASYKETKGDRHYFIISIAYAAVIQPFKLEEVREALEKIGVQSITASEAKGHGRQSGHTETYRGAEYNVSFVSKVKIELAIEASMLGRVIGAIRSSGLSGQIGDGKIFVQDIERAMRIRTGETGQAAL